MSLVPDGRATGWIQVGPAVGAASTEAERIALMREHRSVDATTGWARMGRPGAVWTGGAQLPICIGG